MNNADFPRDFKWYFLRWLTCVADLASGFIGTITLGFVELDGLALKTYSMFLDYEEMLQIKNKMED